MLDVLSRIARVDDELSAHSDEELRLTKDLKIIRLGIKRLRVCKDPASARHLEELIKVRDAVDGLLLSCKRDLQKLTAIRSELHSIKPPAGLALLLRKSF